jgi:hypothetical protein
MTDWARRMAVVAVGALALVSGGCEPPLAPPAVSTDVLNGEWAGCAAGGAGDQLTAILFYPDASYLLTKRTYGTTDGTCGGAQTAARYESWGYALGNAVSASIGLAGTTVTAREITIANALQTTYSIIYTDASVSPHVLYFGDLAADPALDGTAPTKRPQVLSATTGLIAY